VLFICSIQASHRSPFFNLNRGVVVRSAVNWRHQSISHIDSGSRRGVGLCFGSAATVTLRRGLRAEAEAEGTNLPHMEETTVNPQFVPLSTVLKRLLRTSFAVMSLALTTMTLTAGCASTAPPPESMRDNQADFSAYKTFGWDAATSADASGQPLSILDSNIRTAITTELKGKGYEEATAGTTPDLLVSYETARADKIKNNPVRVGIGVGGWSGNGGGSVGVGSSSVKNVNEGTLMVRAIDRTRNAEVWQGRVSRDLGKGNAQPELVQSAVAELFREFPAREGQP
jgi:hypothetical protein